MKRHPAGFATYPGDVTHVVDQMMGPTAYGTYVVAMAAIYDPDTNTTRVAFGHAHPGELQAATQEPFNIYRVRRYEDA